jgi:hypothetical protein
MAMTDELGSMLKEAAVASLKPGLHSDILEIRVENIADIIANCLCVNRVNSSVAGIL